MNIELQKLKPIVYPSWEKLAEDTRTLLQKVSVHLDYKGWLISDELSTEIKANNLLFKRKRSWSGRKHWFSLLPKRKEKPVELSEAIKMVLPDILKGHVESLLNDNYYEEKIIERIMDVVSTDSVIMKLRATYNDPLYDVPKPPKPPKPKKKEKKDGKKSRKTGRKKR